MPDAPRSLPAVSTGIFWPLFSGQVRKRSNGCATRIPITCAIDYVSGRVSLLAILGCWQTGRVGIGRSSGPKALTHSHTHCRRHGTRSFRGELAQRPFCRAEQCKMNTPLKIPVENGFLATSCPNTPMNGGVNETPRKVARSSAAPPRHSGREQPPWFTLP